MHGLIFVTWELVSLPGYGTIDGITLSDLQELLQRRGYAEAHQLRPAVLLEAIQQLQFAGLVKSSANQLGDDLMHRRYWRFRSFRSTTGVPIGPSS